MFERKKSKKRLKKLVKKESISTILRVMADELAEGETAVEVLGALRTAATTCERFENSLDEVPV